MADTFSMSPAVISKVDNYWPANPRCWLEVQEFSKIAVVLVAPESGTDLAIREVERHNR